MTRPWRSCGDHRARTARDDRARQRARLGAEVSLQQVFERCELVHLTDDVQVACHDVESDGDRARQRLVQGRDDEPVDDEDVDDDPEVPDEPAEPGDIVIATASEPFRLDPAIAGSGDEYQLTQAMYNNLIRVDTELEPVPELAESYDVSDDGLIYTLDLRQGINYHHGKEFAAEDAVFTVKRILDEATASPG
jgi:hypothetical protein